MKRITQREGISREKGGVGARQKQNREGERSLAVLDRKTFEEKKKKRGDGLGSSLQGKP